MKEQCLSKFFLQRLELQRWPDYLTYCSLFHNLISSARDLLYTCLNVPMNREAFVFRGLSSCSAYIKHFCISVDNEEKLSHCDANSMHVFQATWRNSRVDKLQAKFLNVCKKEILMRFQVQKQVLQLCKKRSTYKDQTWRTCPDLTGFWGNRKKKRVN